MSTKISGQGSFQFAHRADLHTLPSGVLENEVKLHGMFAADRRAGFGSLYYGMPGSGILRIEPDLKQQDLIELPERLRPLNFHSTKPGLINGQARLFLSAESAELVAVVDLEGRMDFTLSRPEFEQYRSAEARFAPTDTVLLEQMLFVADGYGSNYISSVDVLTRRWKGIFGGSSQAPREDGRFGTAHGIAILPGHTHHHLLIADRPYARLQAHSSDGAFVASHPLPAGAWPCGIDFIQWEGRWLAVIGSLMDPVKDRPAPIYILDSERFDLLATIRPKEEFGLELVQHLHNVVWHAQDGKLFLVCQSWNPGSYFVLEQVS
jgi:hypothetical protein